MKKVLTLLLSSVLLTGCIQYKIEVRPVGDVTYYTPMKRSHGYWRKHYNSPTDKELALEQIQIWKGLENQKRINRRLRYIKIK